MMQYVLQRGGKMGGGFQVHSFSFHIFLIFQIIYDDVFLKLLFFKTENYDDHYFYFCLKKRFMKKILEKLSSFSLV